MDFIQMLFFMFLIVWYMIFIYLYGFLYFNYAKEHKVSSDGEDVKGMPSYINPTNLSKLLYNKILPEVFTSCIINLINNKVLYLKNEDGVDYICVNRNNELKLSSSQKYAIKLLIDYVGDGEKVSLDYLSTYCDTYSGSSNFYINYQVWLKMTIKETNDVMYYEQKMGYYKIKAFKYAGILLFAMNFFVSFRFSIGFFIIIPAFYILFFYYNVYRRTPESQKLYIKWMAYKNYLLNNKHIKVEDAVYAPVFQIVENLEFDNSKVITRLNDILVKDIRRANSYGSKGPAI